MALRLRRGTDAERALITPLAGELIYVTDTRKVYVGDGVTPGGISIDSGALEINDLTDVNTSAGDSTQPADGEVLTWSADNARWEPGPAASGGSTTLNGLTDVEVTGISTTSALVYDTGNSRWEATQFLLSNLSDTFISGTPTTGQVLKWNGFAWAAANDELGDSLTLTNITDVYIPSTPSTGQVLKWNGSVWTNQNEVTDTGITAISQDTNPALGGNLNASGFNINSAGTITATTFSGSGASLTNLNILTDTSPQLGGNLDLNGRNITGSGNIVINNNIQGDIILGNTIAGRFYGDLTGSIFADDSSQFYDSINHVAAVDSLTAISLAAGSFTSTGENPNSSVIIGSDSNPSDGFDDIIITKDLGNPFTTKSLLNASFGPIPKMRFIGVGGDHASKTSANTGDWIGGLSWGVDDSAGNIIPSALVLGQVDPNGVVASDTAKGKLVFLTNNGSASSPSLKFMSWDSRGRLAVNLSEADATLHVDGDAIITGGIDGDLTGSVFADDSTLLVDGVNGTIPGYISIAQLQSIVAASGTYGDFQTNIAAL